MRSTFLAPFKNIIVLLTIVTMMYVGFPKTYSSYNWKFILSDHHLLIFPTSQALATTVLFSVSLSLALLEYTYIKGYTVLVLIYLFIYLFIYGCVGSSLLHAGFLWLRRAGAALRCGAWASHCGGFSCCRAQALGTRASVVVACGLQ